ncbi:MAG TPA: hypothetical protein VGK64_17475 [Bryobacteraceae bacterium]
MTAALCRAILVTAASLVPGGERAEWLAEWRSELWYLHCREAGRSARRRDGGSSTVKFCFGSFRDAWWLRRNQADAVRKVRPWLQSPGRCIAVLIALALVACSVAGFVSAFQRPAMERPFLWPQLFVLGTALLLLRIGTPLAWTECPLVRGVRLRWWIFLGLKTVLVLVIVFFGTLDLGSIIALAPLHPHATLIGYVVGLRWVLRDQRRRCPVCLRLLTNPVRMGEASHMLLGWYGTELICLKGHGLLHVPEIPTSSYSGQRWLRLDPSWRELFS